MNYNRAVMKLEVKQAMRQTRPNPMLVTLLYLVIAGIGASLISRLGDTLFSGGGISLEDILIGLMTEGEDYFENLIYFFSPEYLIRMLTQAALVSALISILTTVWNGLMSAGYSGYCLDMSRNMNPELGRIFSGFSRAGSVILAYILTAVFTFLWSLLFAVALVAVMIILSILATYVSLPVQVYVLLMLAAYIGFIIAIFWAVLRYAMVPFAVIDSQHSIPAMEAIRTSKAIMKGRKGSYFVLQLSFIGWYLLEGLIVFAGVLIAIFSVAGSINGMIGGISMDMLYPGDLDFAKFLAQMFGPVLIVALLCSVGLFILELWLTPYRTGCNARFYTYAMGGAEPIPPAPHGGQPGPYGGRSDPPYGGQPPVRPYGGRPVSGGQPGPYGGQPPVRPYGGQPVSGGQPGPYGGQPPVQPYGGQPVSGGQPGPYGGQPPVQPYGGRPASGGQPGPSGGPSGPSYGGQFGPSYGGQSNPYGYIPPSQSPLGGYVQGPQPPQYGAGSYPQWGAPQAPSSLVTEPLSTSAAPEVPAAPAAPAVPEAPAAPEATTPLFAGDSGDPDPTSKPAIIFGAPDDDTPQPPSDPDYPQY